MSLGALRQRAAVLGRVRPWRRAAQAGGPPPLAAATVITLRLAHEDGDAGVATLVSLSGREGSPGPTLVAEVDGEPRVAIPLSGGPLLSDPFHATDELGSLLHLRRAQLQAAPDTGPRCA